MTKATGCHPYCFPPRPPPPPPMGFGSPLRAERDLCEVQGALGLLVRFQGVRFQDEASKEWPREDDGKSCRPGEHGGPEIDGAGALAARPRGWAGGPARRGAGSGVLWLSACLAPFKTHGAVRTLLLGSLGCPPRASASDPG